MIDHLTRFETSPEFAEALLECHRKNLNPRIGLLSGDFEGRLFFNICSHEWVELAIHDCADGLTFVFFDCRHPICSAPQQWHGLDHALAMFDRCILWHSANEVPLPDIEWINL